MINTGIPLSAALEVVEKQTVNKKLKNALMSIKNSLREGNSFHSCLLQHQNIIDPIMINMVQAGEASGTLGEMLLRLGEHYEREHTIKEKIKSAMIYPLMVMIVSALAVIFMIIVVLPVFTSVISDLSGELPFLTLILINFSDLIRQFWHLSLILTVAFFASVIFYVRTPSGKITSDTLKISFPILGELNKKVISARFCRTFGTLLNAGVPILSAVSITANVIGNSVFAKSLNKCKDVIRDGNRIAKPLYDAGIFPYMVCHMAQIGEETGRLDILLIKTGEYFQDEANRKMDNLSKLIEPFMILFVGGFVGF
jgi:type IV pilus assembly protein PilC